MFYWRIGALPELSNLSPSERRSVLRGAVGVRTYGALVTRSIAVGVVASFIAAVLIVVALPPAARVAIWLTVFLLAGVAWYQVQMRRLRRDLRSGLIEAAGDRRVPVCLECGFDLVAGVGDRCPECGASTAESVSRERDARPAS